MTHRKTAGLGAVVFLIIAILCPASASAAPAYSAVEIAPPVGVTAPEFEFGGISCPAVGSCVAVGHILLNGKPIIATDSGGVWSRMIQVDTPDESGPLIDQTGELSGISCPAVGSCVAVGSYGEGKPMVIEQSGGVWGAATDITPPVGADEAHLSGVSCSSVGSCVAVGSYTIAPGEVRSMLVTDTAGSWEAAVNVSEPTGFADSFLDSVSCTGSGSCVAVGGYWEGGAPAPMRVSASSGTWGQAAGLTAPAGTSGQAALEALSCPSAGACVAVGNYFAGAGFLPMMSSQSSETWSSPTETALPAGGVDGFVGGVSCAAVGSCLAVGGYWTGSEERPWTSARAGATWGPAAGITATPPVQDAQAEAVSCPAIGACVAIGTSHSYTKAIGLSEEVGEAPASGEEGDSAGGGGDSENGNSDESGPDSSRDGSPPSDSAAGSAASGPPTGPAPSESHPSGSPHFASSAGIATVSGSRVQLVVICHGDSERCRGIVKLVAKVEVRTKPHRAGRAVSSAVRRVVIGKARFTVAPAHKSLVRIKLSRRGTGLMRHAGHRGLRVELTGTGIHARSLRLKPQKKHHSGKRRHKRTGQVHS